jgi:tetratricopeptide (TPR) repeat protein
MEALLTPLFRDGIDRPPPLESSSLQSSIMTDLGSAFYHLGRTEEALALEGLANKIFLDDRSAPNLGVGLLNYASSLKAANRLAESLRARELARELADAADDSRGLAFSHLYLLSLHVECGRWAEAEAAYEAFSREPPRDRTDFWRSAAERYRVMMLFYRGEDPSAAIEEAWVLAIKSRDPMGQRQLHRWRGEVALRAGDPGAAAEHFNRAVTMARKAGIQYWGAISGLARAYAELGRREEALALVDQGVNSIDAAEVYLAFEVREEAEERALKAYEEAWADGPPHIWWWELERARAVLAALGIPEPELPPFDSDAVPPLPYEDEIRAFIAELKAQKEE